MTCWMLRFAFEVELCTALLFVPVNVGQCQRSACGHAATQLHEISAVYIIAGHNCWFCFGLYEAILILADCQKYKACIFYFDGPIFHFSSLLVHFFIKFEIPKIPKIALKKLIGAPRTVFTKSFGVSFVIIFVSEI